MITIKKTMTEEELELIYAANYLGPFLLTTSLLDLLKRYQGRVVNVGSVLPSCIVVSYVNTGLVEIKLYRDISWLFILCQSLRKGQGLKSATEGALSVLFCALDDSVQTGGYYSNGQLIDHTPSVPASVYDEGLAKKLWEASERLTGTFEERKRTTGMNGRKIDRFNYKTDIMSELESKLAKRGRAE